MTTPPSPAERAAVSAEPVPAEAYTEEYYLGCCSGADEFEASQGLHVAPELLALFDRMAIGAGARCLDVGCGRGEAVLNLAKRGALAVGVDYAGAALGLAQGMVAAHPDVAGRVLYLRADAKAMPLRGASFDAAFMLDIVEHLQPWELDQVLAEVFTLLRPGATLCVHTMPNLHFYRWVYPVLRLVARVAQGRSAPRDPRSEFEHQMHVNEQTPAMLTRSLERAGFECECWVDGMEKSPIGPGLLDRLVRAAGRRPPFRSLASFHIYVMARRPG